MFKESDNVPKSVLSLNRKYILHFQILKHYEPLLNTKNQNKKGNLIFYKLTTNSIKKKTYGYFHEYLRSALIVQLEISGIILFF